MVDNLNLKINKRHISKLFSIGLIFVFLLSCFFAFFAFAADPNSSDAIAIRVIPNPEHYSPLRWYKDQGFTGSPQSLTVDGYEAIRDGRTVYISSANVTATNLFTNIYLISYNQEAENATVDIFARLLSSWKFNANITEPGNCSEPASAQLISDCSDTIGCWHFDGDYNDSSGKANNGLQFGGGNIVFQNGILNQGINTDGNKDLIIVPISSSIPDDFTRTSDWTFEAWIKPSFSGNEYQNIFNAKYHMPRFSIINSTKSLLLAGNIGGYKDIVELPGVITNKWQQVAVSAKVIGANSMNYKVFHNGNKIADINDGKFDSSSSIYIIGGADWGNEDFKGLIDEIKIYNKALSDDNLKARYTQTYSTCLSDTDCSGKGYCNSPKANITRDTKRLAELTEIKIALDEYKEKTGKYPVLSAGTYLQNKTVSTWPSWAETLSNELGVALPLDPVNKLGECTGYDTATCWNETDKKFSGYSPSDNVFKLPADSRAFIYSASSLGDSYNLCGVMESGYITDLKGGACEGSATAIKYSKIIPNSAPQASCGFMYGSPDAKFAGFLTVYDANNDPIKIELEPISPNNWPAWQANSWQWYGGNTKLIVRNTGVPGQREVGAEKAGKIGDYKFKANVGDGEATSTIECLIKVEFTPPKIDNGIKNEVKNIEIFASSTLAIAKDILTAWQPTSKNYPLTGFIIGALPAEITAQIKVVSDTFVYYLSGVLSNTNTYSQLTTTLSLIAEISDKAGSKSNANFKVTIKNNPPKVNLINCEKNVRVSNDIRAYPYKCIITASDTDTKLENNNVSFFNYSGIPDYDTGHMKAVTTLNTLTISGYSEVTKKGNVTVTAMDEYGQLSQPREFTLNVNNYCGDGNVQFPNNENLGGPDNDGKEECDDGNFTDGDTCNNCEWTCKGIPFNLITLTAPNSKSENIVFDDNNNTGTVADVAGKFLKIDKTMSTPYIWIANSNRNMVSKIRTYNGLKRDCMRDGGQVICENIEGAPETMGQNLGNFPVGANPSRSAVNVETGDVWVANRDSNDVYKLDINGTILKKCAVGGGPRGVAIEKEGDVWIANCTSGTVTLLPGNDTDCAPLATVNAGGACPYGLAVDPDNNIWVNRRADSGSLVKINTTTRTVSNTYALNLAYGIASDKYGNIWLGRWDGGLGIHELKKGAAAITNYPGPYRTTAVTQDLSSNIWFSAYANNKVIKVNQAGGVILERDSGGSNPHGITGDSKGQVWVVNRGSNSIRVFDAAGIEKGNYCVNDLNKNGVCTDDDIVPYSYSDMTGLNRAMVLRSGVWKGAFDAGAGFDNQKWGNISWDGITPAGTEIKVEIRASNKDDFDGADFMLADAWNALNYKDNLRGGRYLQIMITMRSDVVDVTPVLTNLRLECAGSVNNTSGFSMYIPGTILTFPIVDNNTDPEPFQCVNKPSGMLNWWTGDNNPNDIIGGNDGVSQNGSGYAPGLVGGAFNLSGASQYFKISAEIKNNNVFTQEGWVKIDSSGAGNQSIFTTRNAELYYNKTDNNFILQIFQDRNGNFNLTWPPNASTRYYYESDTAGLIEGFWTHIAIVVDGANNGELYVNGAKLNNSPRVTDNNVQTDYNTTIGGNTPRNSEYFKGAIDEVSFYDRALSIDEIRPIYLASSGGKCKNCVNAPNNLVSWWPGDNNANDIKGANNGTQAGGVAYPNGKVDKAFSFSGSSHISIPDTDNSLDMNSATGISFGAWVYPNFKNNEEYIIAKYTGVGQGYWMATRDGKFRVAAGNSTCSNNSTALEYALKDKTWTHVMATISTGVPATIKLYIDGVLRKSSNDAYVCNSNIDLRIGNSTNGLNAYFNGLVDEVMFFNKTLLDTEVKNIFSSGVSGTCKYCSFPITFPCIFE